MDAVLKDALNTKPLNAYDGPTLASYEVHLVGAYVSRIAGDIILLGCSNTVIAPFTIAMPGACRRFMVFECQVPGMFDLALTKVTIDLVGTCQQFVTYTPVMPGVSEHQATYLVEFTSEYNLLKAMEIIAAGSAQCGMGHIVEVLGKHAVNQNIYTRGYRQGYRVANTTLATLELYAGYDAMPDFDDVAQPVATGNPISWTPTYPGPGLTTVLHLVVRERNMYGLLSHNQQPLLIEIDENGDEVLGTITAPEFMKVLDGSSVGSIQVWARYPHEADRNPANTWEVYAKAGSDPVVGVDTPVLTEAIGGVGGGLVPWRGTATGLTTGLTYHFRIAIRRTADDAYMQSDVLQLTIAQVFEVDEGSLTLFAGDEYEINQ